MNDGIKEAFSLIKKIKKAVPVKSYVSLSTDEDNSCLIILVQFKIEGELFAIQKKISMLEINRTEADIEEFFINKFRDEIKGQMKKG